MLLAWPFPVSPALMSVIFYEISFTVMDIQKFKEITKLEIPAYSEYKTGGSNTEETFALRYDLVLNLH